MLSPCSFHSSWSCAALRQGHPASRDQLTDQEQCEAAKRITTRAKILSIDGPKTKRQKCSGFQGRQSGPPQYCKYTKTKLSHTENRKHMCKTASSTVMLSSQVQSSHAINPAKLKKADVRHRTEGFQTLKKQSSYTSEPSRNATTAQKHALPFHRRNKVPNPHAASTKQQNSSELMRTGRSLEGVQMCKVGWIERSSKVTIPRHAWPPKKVHTQMWLARAPVLHLFPRIYSTPIFFKLSGGFESKLLRQITHE